MPQRSGWDRAMDSASHVVAVAETLLLPLINPLSSRSLPSYLAAAFFVFVIVIGVRLRRRRKEIRLKAFWRLLAKRTVWLHRSSLLDYKLYLVNVPLLAFVIGFFIVGADAWADLFTSGLTVLFGSPAETPSPHSGMVVFSPL
eukprot:gene15765-19969_t